jgi:hypothetical protein
MNIDQITNIEYLMSAAGKPKAVVIPIDIWNALIPQQNSSFDELTDAIEDYCLNKAMDEGKQSTLLSRDEALKYLDD